MNIFGFTLPNFTSQAAAAYKANIDAAVAVLCGLAGDVLINGDGMINERGSASGIADDTYDCDRWYTLTQTGTIAYSQLTDVADNVPFMMRMTQSQASAQRMGRAQIIEGKHCKWLRGQQVTLALRHKISSAANIRMAILEWTGTEDTVTSDVINSWTNGTYTAGNFFNSTTLTVRAVSAAISSTTSLAEVTLTATLGSTFNNLIVVIWTEGTAAQNVTLDLAAKFAPGAAAGPWNKRDYGMERRLCARYFQRFRWDSDGVGTIPGGIGYVNSTSQSVFAVGLAVPMRKVIETADISSSTVGSLRVADGSATGVVSALAANKGSSTPLTDTVFQLLVTTNAVLTVGRAAFLKGDGSSATDIKLTTEL